MAGHFISVCMYSALESQLLADVCVPLCTTVRCVFVLYSQDA
jgi:hypothetical protein